MLRIWTLFITIFIISIYILCLNHFVSRLRSKTIYSYIVYTLHFFKNGKQKT